MEPTTGGSISDGAVSGDGGGSSSRRPGRERDGTETTATTRRYSVTDGRAGGHQAEHAPSTTANSNSNSTNRPSNPRPDTPTIDEDVDTYSIPPIGAPHRRPDSPHPDHASIDNGEYSDSGYNDGENDSGDDSNDVDDDDEVSSLISRSQAYDLVDHLIPGFPTNLQRRLQRPGRGVHNVPAPSRSRNNNSNNNNIETTNTIGHLLSQISNNTTNFNPALRGEDLFAALLGHDRANLMLESQIPIDVRKPDKLVCPTCMTVHLPVRGSERIGIPEEEVDDEGGAGAGDNDNATENQQPATTTANNTRQGGRTGDNNENDNEDDNESSSSHDSMPPLSSDISSAASNGNNSLDSLPPLVAPQSEENHNASLDASNLTAPGERGPGNYNTSFNASNVTVHPSTRAAIPPPHWSARAAAELAAQFETAAMREAMSEYTIFHGHEDESNDGNDDYGSMPSLETVERDGVDIAGAASTDDGGGGVNNEQDSGEEEDLNDADESWPTSLASSDDSMPPLEDVDEDEGNDNQDNDYNDNARNAMYAAVEEALFSRNNINAAVYNVAVRLGAQEELLRSNENSSSIGVADSNESLGSSSNDDSMLSLEDVEYYEEGNIRLAIADEEEVEIESPQQAQQQQQQQEGNNSSSNEQVLAEIQHRSIIARMNAAQRAVRMNEHAVRMNETYGTAIEMIPRVSTETLPAAASAVEAANGYFMAFARAARTDDDNDENDDDDDDNENDNEVAQHANNGNDNASSLSSSIPDLVHRTNSSSDEDNSFSSMPPLMQRDISSSSSDSDSSMPALVRSTAAATRARRGPLLVGGGGGGEETGYDRFRRLQMAMLSRNRNENNNNGNNDSDHSRNTNPLTHLRDYGALRVFASATCPICLDVHEPIVALPCGHALCEDDFRRLGGYLACEKDKLKKLAADRAGAGAGAGASRGNAPILPPRALERATRRIPRSNGAAGAAASIQTPSGIRSIPTSVTIETSPGTNPPRRGSSQRGTVWAHGITSHCPNEDCQYDGTIHCVLFSVRDTSETDTGDSDDDLECLKHESCYPVNTKIVPDGHGGLWIHEARRVIDDDDDTINNNWPVWHKNKHREVEKFQVPRDADLEADGAGGIWAIIPGPELENGNNNNHGAEIKRYIPGSLPSHVAWVPDGSDLYFGGRRGKVWVYSYMERGVDYDGDMLDEGLWLLGSHDAEKLGETNDGVGFSTGDVDPDGSGNLWYLEENAHMDTVILKRCMHNGDRESTSFEFPIDGTEVYGCDSNTGVFVFHEPPGVHDYDAGQLTYVSKESGSRRWTRATVAWCPTDTKFASNGAGGLWALMVDDDGECKLCKCNGMGMEPVHEWTLPFPSAELVGG
mmetsp:Transcript_2917/g.6305  ORF Transcript_2917/g.6305 Transcript_2917/m.6305 type:complete len:1354 (+) Transcript_2917:30-4091(+)